MADPVVKREDLLREDRIKFLSELLMVAHKHRSYIKQAGEYDSTVQGIEGLRKSIQAARRIRREDYREKFRDRERAVIRTGIDLAFGQLFRSTPDTRIRVGGKPYVEILSRKASFVVTVGWLWARKVYAPLYKDCNIDYGKRVILSAEKRRVNQKWIELYEVLAYDHDAKGMVNGYVAKTKTDKKNVAFSIEAAKAVNKALDMMNEEMNEQLVGKGSEHD